MAINFEAANMAGYNNPNIEVFTAVLSSSGASLDRYPAKSVILNCISRGSIPVIMLRLGTAGYIMPLSYYDSNEIGPFMTFTTISGVSGSPKIEIKYPDTDNDEPLVSIE